MRISRRTSAFGMTLSMLLAMVGTQAQAASSQWRPASEAFGAGAVKQQAVARVARSPMRSAGSASTPRYLRRGASNSYWERPTPTRAYPSYRRQAAPAWPAHGAQARSNAWPGMSMWPNPFQQMTRAWPQPMPMFSNSYPPRPPAGRWNAPPRAWPVTRDHRVATSQLKRRLPVAPPRPLARANPYVAQRRIGGGPVWRPAAMPPSASTVPPRSIDMRPRVIGNRLASSPRPTYAPPMGGFRPPAYGRVEQNKRVAENRARTERLPGWVTTYQDDIGQAACSWCGGS